MERTRSRSQKPEILSLRQFPLFNRPGQENGDLEHTEPGIHCGRQELRTRRGGKCLAQSPGKQPRSSPHIGYFLYSDSIANILLKNTF